MARSVSALVSAGWLAGKLSASSRSLRVLDGSWHLPTTKRSALREYNIEHIPNAMFFDIEECSDKSSKFPHTVPSKSYFESYVNTLGVHNDTHIVVYDNNKEIGGLSAHRVWWMFRMFGHPWISVLDGGLPYWKKCGYATTDEITVMEPSNFKASGPDLSQMKTFEQMEENVNTGCSQFAVVDARSKGRFEGTAPEPRADVEPGHIPNTINLPFPSMIDSETKLMKSPVELRKVFKSSGVDLDKPFTATCGSGMTACIVALGAHLCGKDDVPIYDGSWTEWYKRAKPEHIITGKEE